MLEQLYMLTILSELSRLKTNYDYLHAKNFDDLYQIGMESIVLEHLFYLAEQNIRNRNYPW